MKYVLVLFAIILNASSLVIMFADWITFYSIIMSFIGMIIGLLISEIKGIKRVLVLSFVVVVFVVILRTVMGNR